MKIYECTKCGDIMEFMLANETKDGKRKYYRCERCGHIESDMTLVETIVDTNDFEIVECENFNIKVSLKEK